MKVLGTQEIEFCEVKSDEEINKKYLDKFLQYSLLQNLIEKSKNAKVYYHYFRSKKKYFIYINQKQGEVYIVPEILFTLNLEKDKYYLLFYKNYFYLYLNNKIIFFQKYNSSESSEEDIKNFLKFVYDVEIFDKAYINEEEFNILLFKKNEKKQNKMFKKSISFSFNYKYVLASFIPIALVVFLFSNKEFLKEEKKVIVIENKKTSFSSKFNKFVFTLNKNSILLKNCDITNNIASIKIAQKNHLRLYSFLEDYSTYLKVRSFSYDKKSKYYEMDLQFKL